MKPLIVVEGPTEQFDHAVGEVRARGWTVLPGWPGSGTDASRAVTGVARTADAPVFVGAVAGPADAAAAVTAVMAGAGVVAHGLAAPQVLGALCDDLRHLGRLDHRVGECRVALTGEERDLLELLLEGCTVASAARRLFLSRRSVERRLAALRNRFEVATPIELLAAYRAQAQAVPPAPAER